MPQGLHASLSLALQANTTSEEQCADRIHASAAQPGGRRSKKKMQKRPPDEELPSEVPGRPAAPQLVPGAKNRLYSTIEDVTE